MGTFAQLTASNGEEFEIKYSTENKEMTTADGKNFGIQAGAKKRKGFGLRIP